MKPADTVKVPYALNREDREWLAKHLKLCGYKPDLPWFSAQTAMDLGPDGWKTLELNASSWWLADAGLQSDTQAGS